MKTLKNFFKTLFNLVRIYFLEILGLMIILAFEDMGILNPNWSAFLSFFIALTTFFTFVWLYGKDKK